MSYILDAIKKSEAERGHGTIPGLQTVHSSSLSYKTDSRPVWPYILISLLLLNLAGIVYYFSVSGDNRNFTESELVTTVNAPLSTTTNRTQSNDLPATTIARTATVVHQPTNATAVKTTPAADVRYDIADAYSQSPSPVNDDVIAIEDLPENIKQGIPPMNFNGHVFSSSRIQRSIIVNGDFMEEGDALNTNILLREITEKGAIFDYHGTLFSVNILTGWNTHK